LIIYGDVLFLENTVIGGVLLYITAQIYGVEFIHIKERLKFLIGSIMCGVFSLTVFLALHAFAMVVMEIVFAFLVCFVVFGRNKLWQRSAVFILVTYFMGGMIMGLLYATRSPGIYTAAGIYTGDMKAVLLALFTVLFFVTAKQIVTTIRNRKFADEHIFKAVIESGNIKISTKAFLDTGNQLREPVSGRPVAVADEKLWRQMKEYGLLQMEKFCMIPYESVGAKGLLEAVRVDCITLYKCSDRVDEEAECPDTVRDTVRSIRNCVIAGNDGTFALHGADAKECGLLLSKYMADKGI